MYSLHVMANKPKRKFLDDVEKLIIHNFKRLRKEKGWTQQQLADKAGVDKGYIGGIENMSNPFATESQINYAQIFGVNRLEFYRGIPDITKDEFECLILYSRLRDLGHLDEIIGYAKYLLEVNNNKKKKEAT